MTAKGSELQKNFFFFFEEADRTCRWLWASSCCRDSSCKRDQKEDTNAEEAKKLSTITEWEPKKRRPLPRTGQKLVSRCFEPSHPQRIITSGLNTNFTLSPSYSFLKSSYHKSCFVNLFIFRGHSTFEPASSRVSCFILRAYTGSCVSHSQHRKKIGRGFGKNAGEWTGRVETIRKNPWQYA